MGVLDGLKPERVFHYFEEICNIPHGSGNTSAIAKYCVSFAKEMGLECISDKFNNVLIRKPAYTGRENCKPLLLQGHLDMVCEKNFDYDPKFDFSKDPLRLSLMDDYVFAKGTTLGGDDGIAVAYMLAILEDDTIVHPELECLFTSDEEAGMEGMKGFDASAVKARRMINIDNEKEGEILVSSAGGRKVKCHIPVRYNNVSGMSYDIIICGLLGGHSGSEIDKYRGNANLLMGRLLHYLSEKLDYQLYYLKGGLQDNAIPREAKASVLIDPKDSAYFEDLITEFEKTVINEYRQIENNITIYCEAGDITEEHVLSPKTKERIIFLLMTIPDGIAKMCPESQNIVQTSSNAGIMRLRQDYFSLIISIRSSISSEKSAMSDKIKYLTETIGGEYIIESDYPAWEYKEVSPLRDMVSKAYVELFDKEPRVTSIHAGLECGLIYDKLNGIDIVSIGPDIEDIHTPKEKLNISSTERTWRLLLKIMEMCD
ncbi:MAG: aminoacyl-histidine dipeptidase [Lachnospiraceae bacterium]|nr:aminoacyl-histidine dipeptidase [Lachnospiraceae bacterium]MBR6486616.1 aminoacyl-histidine dipeptidase [Lachnospiraceae bacterium]